MRRVQEELVDTLLSIGRSGDGFHDASHVVFEQARPPGSVRDASHCCTSCTHWHSPTHYVPAFFWLWLLLGGSLHERSSIAFAFSRKQLADRQCADRHSLPRNVTCLAICLLAWLALSSAAQACRRVGHLTIAWTVSGTMLKYVMFRA